MKLSLKIKELKDIRISKKVFFIILLIAIISGGLLAFINWQVKTEKVSFNFNNLSINLEGTYYGKDGGFNSPIGITVGKSNEIYVADSGRHQIAVLNSKGEEIKRIGSLGKTLGQINYPVSVIYSEKPKAKLFVSELGNNRVQIFDLKGKSLGLFNFKGRKPQALTTIYLDNQSNLYVVDKGSQEVLIYSPEGEFIRSIGKLSKDNLNFPMGIAVRGSGTIYIADSGNAEIKVFDSYGSLLKKLPTKEPSGLFSNPRGLVFDQMGNLYVTDALRNIVIVFDKSLKLIGTVSIPERYTAMFMPDGITWDKGYVYVIDKGNGRVVKFSVNKAIKWGL